MYYYIGEWISHDLSVPCMLRKRLFYLIHGHISDILSIPTLFQIKLHYINNKLFPIIFI